MLDSIEERNRSRDYVGQCPY